LIIGLATRAWRIRRDSRVWVGTQIRIASFHRQHVGTHRRGCVAAYCITVLETEVEILDIELQVRKNELSRRKRVAQGARISSGSRKRGPSRVQYFLSDLLPYNARHLIAIELDDGILHHDLLS
jgi:hypothetical protein